MLLFQNCQYMRLSISGLSSKRGKLHVGNGIIWNVIIMVINAIRLNYYCNIWKILFFNGQPDEQCGWNNNSHHSRILSYFLCKHTHYRLVFVHYFSINSTMVNNDDIWVKNYIAHLIISRYT